MSATDDEQQRDEDDERAARERRERREERRRRKERTRREGLRRRLGDSSAFKRETFYALENLNRANWPAKIVGGALFALILLNAVVVFVSAQPGLDPVAANIIQGFYRFSTVCFFVEYIARIWIADLAYGNCTPARARLRYIFSPWGIIDFLSFGPNMAAWFLPVTPALQNIISVVRLVRLIKISRYMRGLRTIGRVISKHYHEIVASFLVICHGRGSGQCRDVRDRAPGSARQVQQLAVRHLLGRDHGDRHRLRRFGAHYTGRPHRGLGHHVPLGGTRGHSGGIFSAGFVAEFQNANLRKIERDVRREDARQDNRDEEERAADEEAEPDTPPPSQRAHK